MQTKSHVISELFLELGHTWTRDGKPFQPTPADVEDVINEGVQALDAEPQDSVFFRGGIMVHKIGTGHDIYVQIDRK